MGCLLCQGRSWQYLQLRLSPGNFLQLAFETTSAFKCKSSHFATLRCTSSAPLLTQVRSPLKPPSSKRTLVPPALLWSQASFYPSSSAPPWPPYCPQRKPTCTTWITLVPTNWRWRPGESWRGSGIGLFTLRTFRFLRGSKGTEVGQFVLFLGSIPVLQCFFFST